MVAVTSLASCRAFGKAICAEFKELSVLCLNAGRGGAKGTVGTQSHATRQLPRPDLDLMVA